jgi:hypothetical protein
MRDANVIFLDPEHNNVTDEARRAVEERKAAMKHNTTSFWHRCAGRAAAALALALLVAAPASAAADALTVEATVPVVVPLGYSTHAGAGFTPSIGWSFGEHLNVSLTSGFVYYYEGDHNERTVPVLLGASWTFRNFNAVLPYVALRAGYTYAVGADQSPHWLTVMGGVGVLVPTRWSWAFDLGFDVLVADVRGNSRDPVGLMLKLGMVYWR